MKIIARVNTDTVLCEVPIREIVRLHGCNSKYDSNWDKKWEEVGSEFELDKAFATLDAIRSFDPSYLRSIESSIKRMTKAFDDINEQYEKLTLFDKLKNTE